MFKVRAMKGRAFALLFVSGFLMLGGCNKATGTVSGHVTYQGKALDHGSVTLFYPEGAGVGGEIQSDGSYLIADAPPGKAKVVVSSVDPKMTEDAKKMLDAIRNNPNPTAAPPPPKLDPKKYHNLPDEYGDVTKSKIEIDVHVGKNELDISLK
jgi:hypothetical protein